MYTKDNIINTYKRIVAERKNADISVSELCREAGIARKTFYYHFTDRYDVLEQILITDIETPLIKALKLNYEHKELVRLIFENLLLDRDFYRIAMLENAQNSLFETTVQHLADITTDYYRDDDRAGLTKHEIEYINYRFAVEITFMIRKWMMEGMKETPEFMSKVVVFPK